MSRRRERILREEAQYLAAVVRVTLRGDVDEEAVADAIYTALYALEDSRVGSRLFVEYHRGLPTPEPRLLESFQRLVEFWSAWAWIGRFIAGRILKG